MYCKFKEITKGHYRCENCNFDLRTNETLDTEKIHMHCSKAKKPTLKRKAKNFTKSMVGFTKSGFKMVSSEEKERRMKICQACELFENGVCTHEDCGCFLKQKTKIESQSCPIGKW